jgi:hypothetical protein
VWVTTLIGFGLLTGLRLRRQADAAGRADAMPNHLRE